MGSLSTRTPPRPAPRVPPAERSQDRILAAAAELAKERGVAGATIARVCQRSGLPVSSVYWHFEDKDALFAEVIKASFARWLVTVPQWRIDGGMTPSEGMANILQPAARNAADVPAFLRVGMQVILDTSETNAKSREAYLDARAQARRMIATWLGQLLGEAIDGATADDLAVMTVAFSDGLLTGSQVYDDFDPDEYIDLFAAVTGHLQSLT